MNPSVYIETTIPSYLVARPSRDVVLAGHQEATREFWTLRKHQFDLYISALVIDEAGSGEPEMAAKRLECLRGLKILNSTDESDALALLLVARLGLPKKAEADAYHIAIAAVYSMDFLLTWNCKHIHNLHMQRRIEETCRKAGFVPPVIGTPDELI
ncbi:hypothetical protein GCM10023213_41780 [Prosthecobacter algae]|uniref:Nucleic acid-binding protein n=1 Tax=Prosthecobacter algae TaxID=1144682 RepID=A0ABP9PM03_9BACT